jgi:hypothetical protein
MIASVSALRFHQISGFIKPLVSGKKKLPGSPDSPSNPQPPKPKLPDIDQGTEPIVPPKYQSIPGGSALV